MPFVLPRELRIAEKLVLVLAFGKLSLLEACSTLAGSLEKAEVPSERVAVLSLKPLSAQRLASLSGVHKWGPLLEVTDGTSPASKALVEALAGHFDAIGNFSVSGYDVAGDDYEDLVRALLDRLKDSGFVKVRLLRPHGEELMAEQVLTRQALDILAFPFHGGLGLAPTAWVSDPGMFRGRGVGKPSPHSDISMSPRLAKLLINLAGLVPGQTVVDPFCGTGTILAEALLGGMNCVGFDANPGRVKDANRNLDWAVGGVKTNRYVIRTGDARRLNRLLDRGKVDAVVTEPILVPRLKARPRTQTAEELLGPKERIYAESLASMAEVLAPGGRIVIVVPVIRTMEGEEVTITLEGRELGLKNHQPGPVGFDYPVRPSFESTRWVGRAVYVFESRV
ncbi:MAG: hypothetical protein HY296_08115 [Thaumarchaeota archaeon]|nr:hypothetical protein [Nitrososphaerota archaeon]